MGDPTPTRRRVLELAGSLGLAALAGCSTRAPTAGTDSATTSDDTQTSTATATSPYTRVYRQTVDSVVLVRADGSQGTGFVPRRPYVVTNAHVVDDASTVEIRYSEGRWSTGEVVGTDPHSDLAVIDVDDPVPEAGPLSFAERPPTVGQEVVAIGNPFDLGGTVTAGIVSGVDRSIPAPTGSRIPDAIQTDAAVNPGNSGGPLVSLEGEVVAVINSGGGENIAFGISAALARRVVPRLIEDGEYDHSFVGVRIRPVTPAIAEAIEMSEARGLLVTQILDDGPAEGILRGGTEDRLVDGTSVRVGGDVLREIDGEPLRTTEDLGSYLALNTRPGEEVTFSVRRDGSTVTLDLELGTRPSA
ncbi:S1C family serine protease [Halobellus ordinarius]|uniref:S1C family serine protease n=1 Tax=Halobellus ordinarius TaxID=3075120 RepID=UPI0028809489|nr:trypsin-like peptidase domain-containing protein [Halobellus sp. ZY16]